MLLRLDVRGKGEWCCTKGNALPKKGNVVKKIRFFMRKIRISNLLLRKVINNSKQYGDYRFLDLYIRYENVMNWWG